MFKTKPKYIAVLEPNPRVGFKAYVEEIPEIRAEGNKISEIYESLLSQISTKLKKDKKQIHLITSVRVTI
ncbi:MAG: hypothetical protein NZ551_10360 [Microscillaceae bacterium]|nr:hypothetical protein [Microscillaceae bacterium]MDW8461600.1 hypothetical protein [Cytophagales bacterium]